MCKLLLNILCALSQNVTWSSNLWNFFTCLYSFCCRLSVNKQVYFYRCFIQNHLSMMFGFTTCLLWLPSIFSIQLLKFHFSSSAPWSISKQEGQKSNYKTTKKVFWLQSFWHFLYMWLSSLVTIHFSEKKNCLPNMELKSERSLSFNSMFLNSFCWWHAFIANFLYSFVPAQIYKD